MLQVFGSWSYTTQKMNLSTIANGIVMDSYKQNGEWEIMGTSVKREEFAFECCPHEKFSNIVFSVHIR